MRQPKRNLISLSKVINTAFEWKALMAKPFVPGTLNVNLLNDNFQLCCFCQEPCSCQINDLISFAKSDKHRFT